MAERADATDADRRGRAAGPRDAGRARSRSGLSRARFLRLGAAALFAALCAPRPAGGDEHHTLDTRRIIELTNQSRRKEGLPPLDVDERLMAAARAKLFDMLKRDYFAHRSPDGRQPWDFMRAAGYRYQMAGENLAKGYDSETEMQRGWMRSHGHRANILNARFTQIGVADANGIAVVMFGRPAPR